MAHSSGTIRETLAQSVERCGPIRLLIEHCNGLLAEENKNFPYQEESPIIVVNNYIRFPYPIPLSTYLHGNWEIRVEDSDGRSLVIVDMRQIESVVFYPGHGV